MRRACLRLALRLALVAAVGCSSGDSAPADVPPSGDEAGTLTVRDLTGVPTRAVWAQAEGSDPITRSEDLVLMGFDTEDGRGERVILGERGNYTKPLITPGGDRIVFTRRQSQDIFIVDWEGSEPRHLADGFALGDYN